MNTRRQFLFSLAISASAPVFLLNRAFGETPPPVKLEENDPVALALGYKEDTNKVDAQKYPQHKPEQKCSDCALYSGKPGDPTGPCSAFSNKLVHSGGWCSAFVKKPETPKP